MRLEAHIVIAGDPFCNWTGSEAGRRIQSDAAADIGVDPSDMTCGCRSLAKAKRNARALRGYFKRGRVKVVAGRCPADIEADALRAEMAAVRAGASA